MLRIYKNTLLIFVLSYIYLPLFAFFIGWVKPVFSVPCTLICLYYLLKFYKEKKNEKSEKYIDISWINLIAISLFLIIISIYSGYCGFVDQVYDWYKHNVIVQDLYTHSWPVVYTHDGVSYMLTYYESFYMIPALIGKLFDSHFVTEIMLGIWGMIGLWLTIMFIFIITEASNWLKQISVVLLFFAFSGMMFPLQKACHLLTGETYCNDWFNLNISGHNLQFRSIYALFTWSGPQAFCSWLATILFFNDAKNIKWFALLSLPVLFSSTWAFLGLIIIMIYSILINLSSKHIYSQIFSFSNVLLALFPGNICYLYLTNNMAVNDNNGISLITFHGIGWLLFCLFLFFSYGIYVLLIWYENRKNVLFYIVPISLLIIPFFNVGYDNDFVIYVSIPSIFLLFIFVCQYLLNNKYSIRKLVLCICICIGGFYPYIMIRNSILNPKCKNDTSYSKQTLLWRFDDQLNIQKNGILMVNYISLYNDENIFCKYIAK